MYSQDKIDVALKVFHPCGSVTFLSVFHHYIFMHGKTTDSPEKSMVLYLYSI